VKKSNFFEGEKKGKNFWNLLPTRFFKKVAFFRQKVDFFGEKPLMSSAGIELGPFSCVEDRNT